jgi:hypothetical protein
MDSTRLSMHFLSFLFVFYFLLFLFCYSNLFVKCIFDAQRRFFDALLLPSNSLHSAWFLSVFSWRSVGKKGMKRKHSEKEFRANDLREFYSDKENCWFCGCVEVHPIQVTIFFANKDKSVRVRPVPSQIRLSSFQLLICSDLLILNDRISMRMP